MEHSQTDPYPNDPTQPQVQPENSHGHAVHNGYVPTAGNQNDQHHFSQPPPTIYVPETNDHHHHTQPPESKPPPQHQPVVHDHHRLHQYPPYQNHMITQPAPNPYAHFKHQPAPHPTQSPPYPQSYPPPQLYQQPVYNNYNQQAQAVQFLPHKNNISGGQAAGYAASTAAAAHNNTPTPMYGAAAAQGYPIPVPNHHQVPLSKWNSELFDCMDDPMNAVITACFPCITFGQIAEIVDDGNTSCGTSGLLYGLIALLIGVPCIMSCTYRTKMRSKYGLLESPAPDWVTHCLCDCCALCQEYRELKHRGLDPSIGWQANMALAQQQQQVYTVPPTNQRMTG